MAKRKFGVLDDARNVYPETPSDKVLGAIFINIGVRIVISLIILLIARYIIFLPRTWLAAKIFWGIVLLGDLVYIGYFLYTFHLYLQENMRKIIERRKAELKKQAAKDSKTRSPDDLKTDGHP